MAGSTDTPSRSLALLTDLYQLTMAYGYWKLGRGEHEACFAMEFRERPFDGGYAVAAGLEPAIAFIQSLRFDETDLAYLAELKAPGGELMFERAFLDYLRELRFTCDIEAVEEGTVVFPHQPLLRVTGPILQGQLLETPLLNIVGFQTLIATKAARVCEAAGDGEAVIEFGLRRAQGVDGGLAASRASYVGGCGATSNVLAGRDFAIPVRGTHAHSWVMSFTHERESFERWAEVMPHNAILLVDTYDTLTGLENAARVGAAMQRQGKRFGGIRLDSGDLAYLSIRAREILDAQGLTQARVLASGDLDEHVIASLRQQGARIDLWGVGTRLATAYDQPALGGVYKLSAIRAGASDPWRYTVKLTEQAAKVNAPGLLGVRRYYYDGKFMADMVYDRQTELPQSPTIVDPADPTRRRVIPTATRCDELLRPIFRGGELVYDPPGIHQARQRTLSQLEALDPTIKRLLNPHEYPVGLEKSLHQLKTQLILEARGLAE